MVDKTKYAANNWHIRGHKITYSFMTSNELTLCFRRNFQSIMRITNLLTKRFVMHIYKHKTIVYCLVLNDIYLFRLALNFI